MSARKTKQPAVGEERPLAERVTEMSRQELERRVLTQRDYIAKFCACIDGFGLHNGLDGHRLPGDVRAAFAGLVRAAAANSEKASDAEQARVRLQRVVGLLARWREHATMLLAAAQKLEAEGHEYVALERRARAGEVQMCISDIEEELAGKKPNDQALRRGEEKL